MKSKGKHKITLSKPAGVETLLDKGELDKTSPPGVGSQGQLILFTRRTAVKTQLTRNRQLLTKDPKNVTPKAKGPESMTTIHSQPHRQIRRLEPSPFRLRISPRPSSHPSSLLSLRSLSHLSSKTFLSRSHPRHLHPRMQNSAHREHRADKMILERTESSRADRGSPKGWAFRGQVWDR